MNTLIERLQTALETLGLKAVEARLENLLEQASKKEPKSRVGFADNSRLDGLGASLPVYNSKTVR